ncbi:MAG: hypothetical protein IPL39_14470 [Opitutaceae bacterium]|nr:hypothetical protein [Opitutaceae bacterium]
MPSRLAALAAKTTIREYAQGAAQEGVAPVADFLAPTVEVASPTGYYKVYSEKSRFRVPNTKRAIGGRATVLGFDASDATFNCAPHALDVPIDQVEGMADESMEALLQEGADMANEAASLAHEQTVIDTAIATLTAGAGAIDFAADKDLVDQLDQQIIAIIKAANYGSLMGIGLLFGPTFFRRFKNHPSVKGRFISGGKKEIVNPSIDDILSLFIAKPEAQLSMLVKDTAPEGKAASYDFLLDSNLIVFARKQAPTRRDPSFMKTFRLKGAWMAPRVYTRDDGRVEVAAMDWSEQVNVTNSAAGKLLTISN